MSPHTKNTDEVQIPKWAQDYEVGDKIFYLNPEMDRVEDSTILGFSTKKKTEGYPVIRPPEGVRAREAAIAESCHYSKNDLKQNSD